METKRKRIKNAGGTVARQVRVSTVNFQTFMWVTGDGFIYLDTLEHVTKAGLLSFILAKILILRILHKILQFIFPINISPGMKEKEKLEETLARISRY